MRSEPLGGEPMLAPPPPNSGAQVEQIMSGSAGMAPGAAANDPTRGGGTSVA